MWHRKTSQATLNSRCLKTAALAIPEIPGAIRRKTAVASKRGDRWFTKPLSPLTWFQKPWLKCQYGPQKSQLGAFTCVTMSVHLCLGSVRCAEKVHVSPSESVSSGHTRNRSNDALLLMEGADLVWSKTCGKKSVVWAAAALSHSQAKAAWTPNHSHTYSAWRSQVPQSTSLANMHRSDAATLRNDSKKTGAQEQRMRNSNGAFHSFCYT